MSASTSPTRAPQRPCVLPVDVAGCTKGSVAATASSVDRLLSDIAFQRQRERERAAERGRRKRDRQRNGYADEQLGRTATDGTATAITSGTTLSEIDDEAASAYWWTDMFLRYFVFDEDNVKTNITADTDDLLFFVRRRRNKRKCTKRQSSSQHRRLVSYETRPYRKQHQQQNRLKPSMLPIGDPAVLWRHTVCLNAIVHRLRYTLTVAVCARVPRKSTAVTVTDYYYQYDFVDDCRDAEGFDFNDGQDREYDLQLLSRHVHTVYASTSGRRMDAAKGPRERPVYPALCWAADDYAEAFRTVIVRPGQTVCAELVATWPGPAVEEYADDTGEQGEDDGGGGSYGQDGGFCDYDHTTSLPFRRKSTPAKQKQNRAVLFAGAIPYAAVRAAYECKMSLYREAENQRRKLRRQQRKRGGKKSSLGAALSASLTALFTGGKDPAAAGYPSDYGEYDYTYGAASGGANAERVEYVTVRGCHPACVDDNDDDDDDDDGGDGDGDGESPTFDDGIRCNGDFDDGGSVNSADYDDTKGLAQMAVTLAPVQRADTTTPNYDGGEGDYPHLQQQHQCYGDAGYDEDCGGGGGGGGGGYDFVGYHLHDTAGDCDDLADFTVVQYQQHHQPQLESSSYPAASTTSEPGDFYDYGWDYETTAGSGQQTPQTPSYHYQVQQQQQLERRRRRRTGRTRRLSDPCSTSVYDLLPDGQSGQQRQWYQQQLAISNYYYNKQVGGGGNWKSQQNYNQHHQPQPHYWYGGTSVVTTPVTPGRADRSQQPHRAWSESDGLDRCGGGGGGINGFVQQQQQQQQRKRQRPLPVPPLPVPYYCAAEAAASGFVQCIRKSPGGWWTRKKNRKCAKRNKKKKRKPRRQSDQSMVAVNRRRSASAGGNANHSYASTTDDDDDDDDDDNGDDNYGTGSDGADSNSDDQESDGEFIGALAAAAAFGHDPDREWTRYGATGNPIADWDQYDSDSDESALDDTTIDDGDMVEWTVEIAATDLRRRPSYRKWSSIPIVTSKMMMMMHDNDLNNSCGRQIQLMSSPFDTNRSQQHQSQQFNHISCQQPNRRRPPPPQFRPQPIEPPPRPPALSVAFTAVACPWWTVLEDVLLVATSGGSSSSNKMSTGMPLLTFD